MFFCPPLSGVCSSYTAVNELPFFFFSLSLLIRLSPFSLQLFFSCVDPHLLLFSWSRTLQTQAHTDPLLLCSPSLPAHPPLSLFTRQQMKGLRWPPASEILQNYPADVSPGVSVCVRLFTHRHEQVNWRSNFLFCYRVRKKADLISQTKEYPERST